MGMEDEEVIVDLMTFEMKSLLLANMIREFFVNGNLDDLHETLDDGDIPFGWTDVGKDEVCQFVHKHEHRADELSGRLYDIVDDLGRQAIYDEEHLEEENVEGNVPQR